MSLYYKWLKEPVIILNFKAYEQAIGNNAVKLARQISKVGDERVYVSVQPTDIRIVKEVWENTLAQHVDPTGTGARTGWIPVESVIRSGAVGTLINHSEHQLSTEDIKKIIARVRSLTTQGIDFGVVSCADTAKRAGEIAALGPDAIAIEPPELIGTNISVSSARPELVEDAVRVVSKYNIPVFCGAGINKPEDVVRAIELGARGVLVASAFVKNDAPGKWLKDVISVL
ncbi:MAG: triose-phosphate isomerase [Thermotogae bacterium]|nr:MAG: triose-phosphate isomerase [Thermotogota bacterium]